jgi:hypothetical protein
MTTPTRRLVKAIAKELSDRRAKRQRQVSITQLRSTLSRTYDLPDQGYGVGTWTTILQAVIDQFPGWVRHKNTLHWEPLRSTIS